MAEPHTYEFNITMSCGGCSGAIDRVLKKLDGSSRPPLLSLFFFFLCPSANHLPQSRRRQLRGFPREPDRQGHHRPPLRDRPRKDRKDRQEDQLCPGRRC